VAVETHEPFSASTVSFLVDLGGKISKRTGEPLVFVPVDQCLDSIAIATTIFVQSSSNLVHKSQM